jgi:Polyketide cyclase / dehydrase and lipid transport
MNIIMPFDTNTPISAEASVLVNLSHEQVFKFVAEKFFENYRKWAPDIIELQPLQDDVAKGCKVRQVRLDKNEKIESIFEVIEYEPNNSLIFQGLNAPYKQTYLTLNGKRKNETELKFRFELMEIEFFMRPFTKLIQTAMQDGVETTVERIKTLLKPKTRRRQKPTDLKRKDKTDAICNR